METSLIINIVIGIAGLLVGYLGGVYLPSKFRKDDLKPNISAGPFQERFNLFELTNHGGDLTELSVEIEWLQDGNREGRKLFRFLNSSDDPLRGQYHTSGSLKRGETKKVSECPKLSDNGNVKILVQGEDLSGKNYVKELNVNNEIKKQ